MKTDPYNPASDGFPAKVWECLRRNQQFKMAIAAFRSSLRTGRQPDVSVIANRETHPCCGLIFLATAGGQRKGQGGWCDKLAKPRVRIEDATWPELPEWLRTSFRSALDSDDVEPKLLEAPPVNELGVPLCYGSPEQKLIFLKWVDRAHTAWLTGRVVAVPRVVRDSERRKKYAAKLLKYLPDAEVRAIKLKDSGTNGGKLLGTFRDWEVFLSHEYIRSTLSAKKSISAHRVQFLADAYTTWYHFEQDSFDLDYLKHLKPAEADNDARQILRDRGEKLRKHLQPVNTGIQRVFPDFKVFDRAVSPPPSTFKK